MPELLRSMSSVATVSVNAGLILTHPPLSTPLCSLSPSALLFPFLFPPLPLLPPLQSPEEIQRLMVDEDLSDIERACLLIR